MLVGIDTGEPSLQGKLGHGIGERTDTGLMWGNEQNRELRTRPSQIFDNGANAVQ